MNISDGNGEGADQLNDSGGNFIFNSNFLK